MILERKLQRINGLLSQGRISVQNGQLGAAKKKFQQALKIVQDLQLSSGESDQIPEALNQHLAVTQAIALNNIGSIHWSRGELARALEFFHLALEIDEEIAPFSIETATDLNNIGTVYWGQGNLKKSQEFFLRALEIGKTTAPASGATATNFSNIGAIFQVQGDLLKALEFYQYALEIDENLSPSSRETALRLNNIGSVYQDQGKLWQALEYYSRALEIHTMINPGDSETAMEINNIGSIYQELNEHVRALHFFQRAFNSQHSIAPRSSETARYLSNIGSVYQDQGELTQALECYQRALSIDKNISPNSSATATRLSNVGTIYWIQGELGSALHYLQQALEIDEEVAPISIATAIRLNNIGGVYRDLDNCQMALSYFQRALKIDEAIAPVSSATATRLSNIGHIYEELGNVNQALQYYQSAVDIIENLRWQAGNASSRESFFTSYQNPYYGIVNCCLLRGDPGDGILAFNMAERTRARTLVERMQEKVIRVETPKQQELLDKEQNILAQISVINRNLHSLTIDDIKLLQEEKLLFEDLHEELRHIEKQIYRDIPGYALLRSSESLTLEQARQEVIEADSLLLSFAVVGQSVICWAIRHESVKDGVQVFFVGSKDDIAASIDTVVKSFNLSPVIEEYERIICNVTEPSPEIQNTLIELRRELAESLENVDAAWKSLSGAIWGQIKESFKEGVSHIFIVPDGALNMVPIGLLPVDRQYLEDFYSISYAPSATALKSLCDLWEDHPSSATDSLEFLGFGDPDFDMKQPSGQIAIEFNRLPGTRREVELVASYFKNAVTFLGRDVTKENIRPCLDRVSVVLGATHGLLNVKDPLGSGLVLTGGDIWEARELLGRRRPLYLDLLVASACSSGQGVSRAGEGWIGFGTALMACGVKCAILSLWPVDDNATCHFMTAFFRTWSQARSVDVALKAARTQMQQHPRYGDDPRFWAAFIAVGLS